MDIWQEALKVIKHQVNKPVYKGWFSSTSLCSRTKDSIDIYVPNMETGNWLSKNYNEIIQDALTKVVGVQLDFNFVTEKRHSESIAIPFDTPPKRNGKSALANTAESHSSEIKPKAPPQKHASNPENSDPDSEELADLDSISEETERRIAVNPNFTFDNFVIGSSNELAANAAKSVAENLGQSYNPLFIYGGVGLGKTHILHAIANFAMDYYPHKKVFYRSTEEFINDMIEGIRNNNMPYFRQRYRECDVLLVDDIQFLTNKDRTQVEFFHTFNTLFQSGKQIVMSSDQLPSNIPALEERLRSRFMWGLVVDVQPPDFETKVAILIKKAEMLEIDLPEDVAYYIANRVTTSVRQLEGSLQRLEAFSRFKEQAISLSFAHDVLEDVLPNQDSNVSVDFIQEMVAQRFKVSMSDLRSKKRSREVAYPRQVAMYLARELTTHSTKDIGKLFGKRDHSTVIHAVGKIKEDIQKNVSLKNVVLSIQNDILQNYNSWCG